MFLLIGESILAKRVYRGCTVSIYRKDTSSGLIELGMVDFDVILGINYFYSCYASIDRRNHIVKFQFSNDPILD